MDRPNPEIRPRRFSKTVENKGVLLYNHKAIQKAVESYRVPEEHKEYLKRFR